MTETNKRKLQARLESLQVYGDPLVGWDENTPPNETVDADGNVIHLGRVSDPDSPIRRVYDDPTVEALRSHCGHF